MSTSAPPGKLPPPPGLPGPPMVDMRASPEMQAWLERLKAEDHQIGKRNKYLSVVLAVAVLLVVVVLWGVYRATIGTYAVLDKVQVTRNPANQGLLQLSFQVVSPGKVYYRRVSGNVAADLVDYFHNPGEVRRAWAWPYQPGKAIDVSLWYRRGVLRKSHAEAFPTAPQADIVILIDTTGSMDRSIAELKEKCVDFSRQLEKQALKHRFALIGFGDTQEGDWLDKHGFTSDVGAFRSSVARIKRFDGGDLPESSLDALEEALSLPMDKDAIRRFYLVTDATYHKPTRSGATPAQIAARLAGEHVLLNVFCKPEFEADYKVLLGDSGKFMEIENFGKVLSEGRVLED